MQDKSMAGLVAAFAALKNNQEWNVFLDAIFAPHELAKLPVRWKLLRELMNRKASQRELSKSHSVAQATAARAQKAFRLHGALLREIAKRADDAIERQ